MEAACCCHLLRSLGSGAFLDQPASQFRQPDLARRFIQIPRPHRDADLHFGNGAKLGHRDLQAVGQRELLQLRQDEMAWADRPPAVSVSA